VRVPSAKAIPVKPLAVNAERRIAKTIELEIRGKLCNVIPRFNNMMQDHEKNAECRDPCRCPENFRLTR